MSINIANLKKVGSANYRLGGVCHHAKRFGNLQHDLRFYWRNPPKSANRIHSDWTSTFLSETLASTHDILLLLLHISSALGFTINVAAGEKLGDPLISAAGGKNSHDEVWT